MDASAICTAIGIGIGLIISMLSGFRWIYGRLDKKFDIVDKRFDELRADMKVVNVELTSQIREVDRKLQDLSGRVCTIEGMLIVSSEQFAIIKFAAQKPISPQ